MQARYGKEIMLCHCTLLSWEWLMSLRYLTTLPEWASQLEECRQISEMISQLEMRGGREIKKQKVV